MIKRHSYISILVATSLFWSSSALMSCSISGGHDDNHEEAPKNSEHHEAHEHEHEHGALIEFNDSLAKLFGVASKVITPSDFSDVIIVSGQIETKASDEAIATATRSGIITISPDINNGSIISAATVIARITASNVQEGDPTVKTMATRNAAKRELDRLTSLHADGIVSDEVYNSALRSFEEADAALRSSTQGNPSVISPKSGVITQLLVKSGEYVEIGQPVAVISGNTSLTLRADVPEKYLRQIQLIKSANFRPASSESTYSIDNLGGKMISKPLSSVSQNGYVPLYFVFNNDGSIAPGSFAEVYLKSSVRHDVMFVPKDAIVEISGNKCIYSSLVDGHYAKHVVTTGATDGHNVEIISGLHKGENVVIAGASVIRMAETSAVSVPGHTHNH